jgi:hypothetical protein
MHTEQPATPRYRLRSALDLSAVVLTIAAATLLIWNNVGRVHYTDRTEQVDLKLPQLPPRILCDPIVYFSRMQNLCRQHRADVTFRDAGWVMTVRRSTDTDFRVVVDAPSFCGPLATYSVFRNNNWLQ